jgi:hypothetical protein
MKPICTSMLAKFYPCKKQVLHIFIYSFPKVYLFIASLHIIKSKKIKKEINRTLKKEEGNLLCF